ncbi:hypothetical protein TKK_0019347 [Trichogramma kaykai]|uniref:Uncharacterized protein n=1 Tax=Trichogramma kaykai TaxID=54128 RepID=A0ABD2VTN2_9HYME
MNDSFLEDLDLLPKEAKAKSSAQLKNKSFITKRKILSPPPSNIQIRDELSDASSKQEKIVSSSCINIHKSKMTRRSGSQEPKNLSIPDGKPHSSTPKSDKKVPQTNENVKPLENQLEVNEFKAKVQEALPLFKNQEKFSADKSNRRSGSSSRLLEVTSKENSRPSTDSSSRDSGSMTDTKKHRKTSEGESKKADILPNTDPVMLLSAIKDLVSRYTEQETLKILGSMSNMYISSQANLIKNLMVQTDELVEKLNSNKNNQNVKSLIEENEKMREEIFVLRTRNEVLQKRVNEMACIKEENVMLKMKLKELEE